MVTFSNQSLTLVVKYKSKKWFYFYEIKKHNGLLGQSVFSIHKRNSKENQNKTDSAVSLYEITFFGEQASLDKRQRRAPPKKQQHLKQKSEGYSKRQGQDSRLGFAGERSNCQHVDGFSRNVPS